MFVQTHGDCRRLLFFLFSFFFGWFSDTIFKVSIMFVLVCIFWQIREELRGKLEAKEFLDYCCPWLLSPLFLHEYTDELAWLAEVGTMSLHELKNLG
jgi:hypothetical protein